MLIYAQSGRQVQGKIIDTTQNPLPGVTVKLFTQGSKDTLHTISGKKGTFSFVNVVSGRFILRAASSEYVLFEKDYQFAETEKNIQLGEIILQHDIKILKEVLVGMPFITIKEDTIDYRADSIILRTDASVEELLKRLPGIEVNKNGVITAQGKLVTRVKVNGKDFFGADVKMATRELPANVVDKIQVIDDYGEEGAHSGIKKNDPVKVINLKLKKDKNKGVFGSSEAGYGSSESYQAKASLNFFNDRSQLSFYGNSNNINNGFVITNTGNSGRIGLMSGGGIVEAGSTGSSNDGGANTGIRQNSGGIPEGITTTYSAGTNFRFDFGKRNSVYGSYSYGNRNTEGFRELYQQNFYSTGYFINNQQYNYNNNGNSHNGYINLELYPDSLSYLKISHDISYYTNQNKSNNGFSYFRDSIYKTSEGHLIDTSKSNRPSVGINIFYNHTFKKKGRNINLSLSLGTNRSNMETNRLGLTRIYNLQGAYLDSTQNQHINEESKENSYNLYFSYTEPLAKNQYLDFTFSHDFSKSSTGRNVFIQEPGAIDFILDSAFSNQYNNRFNNDRIGLSFRTIKKKLNYTLGITLLPVNNKINSAEKDTINTKQQFTNIAPSARFSFAFSKGKNMTFSYRGMNRQPAYLQLQPVRDISNLQFQREGNPGLKPEFRHTVGLTYNSFNVKKGAGLFSSVNFNAIQNKIVNNTILLDSSGAQLNKPENVNGAYNIAGFYTYTKPLEKNKFILRMNGSIIYNHDAILVNSLRKTNKNWFLIQGLQFNYANNKWLDWGAEVNYSVAVSRNLLSQSNNFKNSAWTIATNASLQLPVNIVIKFDFEKIFNQGLAESINSNINLLNISIEKKLVKKKNIYLGISGFNILNQNSSITRVLTGNSITDSRHLQLSRYYLFTFLYRWNKFGAKK